MNYNKNKLDKNCEEVLIKDQNNIKKNIEHEAHLIDQEAIDLLQKK
ncbi:hypothetical protein HIC20_02620 [Buchnera aphidicola (Hormaphis cornu)]|nr:hypothetical protein HIC20_02620 [Buchnera aphidicola (Hormaphis cornu)]